MGRVTARLAAAKTKTGGRTTVYYRAHGDRAEDTPTLQNPRRPLSSPFLLDNSNNIIIIIIKYGAD